MRARNVLLALALIATSAMAQEFGRALELPGHRALISVMEEAELAPFETDGCSGGLSFSWTLVADTFPDFAEAHEQLPPWESCCVTHDRAYHDSGKATTAQDSYQARVEADEALRVCVQETGETRIEEVASYYDASPDQVRTAYKTIADAMYLAVRFGGGPCSGLPWRWGYGYPGCTVFDAVSTARD